MYTYASPESIHAPDVIGHHIHDAIRILSRHNLNVRILAEKQEADIQEGIVVNQSPDKDCKVKSHQSVYLVVTCKPEKKKAPDLVLKSERDAHMYAEKEGIRLNVSFVESLYPEGSCIAQSIPAGEPLDDNAMSIYVSQGTQSTVIFPSLKGISLYEALTFLQKHNMSYKVFHKLSHSYIDKKDMRMYDDYIVADHKPLKGSLIKKNKGQRVQLIIEQE
jgi:beta-lactam-binding protein with PASTA domain